MDYEVLKTTLKTLKSLRSVGETSKDYDSDLEAAIKSIEKVLRYL